MGAPRTESVRSKLETVIALARLLERVEGSSNPVGADQYRALVIQLKAALAVEMPTNALNAVLGAHPAAAELYENMHYDTSGLARSSLEKSVQSEMLASRVIARVSRQPPQAR